MKKFNFARPLLHLAFLSAAILAASYGTFRWGVPAMGDNPGAIAAGILPFFFTYFGLLSFEGIAENFVFQRRPILSGLGGIILLQVASGITLILVFLITSILTAASITQQLQMPASIFIAAILVAFLLLDYFILLALRRLAGWFVAGRFRS